MRRASVVLFVLPALVSTGACGGTSTNTITSPATTRCQIAASTQPSSFPAAGGNGAMVVNTTRDCTWTAAAAADWIVLKEPESGQGEGRVTYFVVPNDHEQERRGAIDVNGVRVQVFQAAAPPPPPPPPPPAPQPDPTPPPSPAPAPNPPPAPSPGPAPNPPPAPSPAPAPNPPPAPAPPPAPNPPPAPPTVPEPEGIGKPVEVKGAIQSLAGSCPLVSMTIAGTRVLTNSDTEFKDKLSCSTLSDGMKVKAKGPRNSDGAIVAQKIERD